ncbi:MAG TPA: hypothetical protein VK476_04015 [Flavobacterium sp.]|nr:hypothetical protein [Flavobacterium sp.]
MKKLVLGLFATIMFGFAGNAQNASYSKSAMTVVVTAAKASFTKGTSYKDWLASQIGNSTIPTKEEDKFLSEVYGFVSTGATSETVLKNYDGKSFLDLAVLNGKDGLKVIKDGTISSANRWCIPCLIKLVVDLMCLIVDCTSPVIPQNP